MDQTEKRDDALFDALNRKKQKRKRKIIRTVVIVVLILAVVLVGGVLYLRRQVAKRVAGSGDDVTSAEATLGSISTQISGSGTLTNVDEESLTVPANVEVEKVLVSTNETVSEGQLLARVDLSTVLSEMSALQDSLNSLDEEITTAVGDAVSNTITAGVAGRVKEIYASKGDDVVACMAEHGALALLSLDGKMAVEIESSALQAGDKVTVYRPDETKLAGTVESVKKGKATILVSDNAPAVGEEVTVQDEAGNTLGTGALSVHSPLRVAGISGTVIAVNTSVNSTVYAGSALFSLSGTSYTAHYQALIKERSETEEDLLELMEIYRNGGVTAPFAGTVSSIDYDETAVVEDTETALATLAPDKSMQVTINVDESNILSLELGQSASVTVSSIGDDTFDGSVTEINKTASTTSGVTRYTAVVTLDKTPEMLQGMSAKVVIRIQGVDNAVIIPVDALHQTSSSSYVYTSYDEELNEFGDPVMVTVGITNSNYAEITSGLKEGDTVWYKKAETNPFANMGFPGGDFGGGMPGGDFRGGMPGGDFGGGRPGGSGSGRPSGDFGGSRPGGSGSGFPGSRG